MTSKALIAIAFSAAFSIAAFSSQAQAQTIINFADTQAPLADSGVALIDSQIPLEETQITLTDTTTQGWVQSLEQAVAESQSSGKPIMLVFSGSDWCSYCQLLEHEVFQTPEFELWSSQNVIKVMVDFPQYQTLSPEVAAQNENLKQHFAAYMKGYPTVLMLEANGSVIGRTGYVAGGPNPWITKADSILMKPAHHLAGTDMPNR